MRQNVFRSAGKVALAAMVIIILTGAFVGQAWAINDILSQWTFESGANTPPSATGTDISGVGSSTGSGTASGHHASSATVWDNPSGNGSAESMSSNNWAAADYYQFQTDTTSFSNIGLQFDQVSSTTGPRDFTLQYSTNGTTFTNFANYSVQPNANPAWGANPVAPLGLDTYNFDLRTITALNNAASVFFRLTTASPVVAAQQGSTPAAGGTDRLDNVTIYNNYDPTQPPVPQPSATPVLPAAGDVVVGLGSGRNKVTLELVRGTVPGTGAKPAPYSAWTDQNFSRFVKFDNLGGTAHNVHGNLLALDTGASTTAGGNIYSYATQGTLALPARQSLGNTGSTGGSPVASTIGGLSVSPDNSKIALAAMNTGKVVVYDYTAGNGLGTGSPALSGVRQSNVILDSVGALVTAGAQEGTAWLNSSTVLAFSASGNLYEVNATSMAETLKKTVTTNAVAQSSTALAYNPGISPYIYAMYSGFAAATNHNTLFVFDPANAYNDLTSGGIDFSTSANTVRDIALDSTGNLFLVTNASTGRLEYIPGVTTPGSITANSSVDWYNDEVFQSQPGFAGLDIGFAAPGLTGDYNGDGKVNSQDYVIWRKTNINGAQGYTDWRSNYGNGGTGAGSGLDGAAVPEPASAVLLIIGLAAFCSRRRSA